MTDVTSARARVAATAIARVTAHARAALPEECCGFLIGHDDRIEDAIAARNVSEQPTIRFLIDPADHFNAIRLARGRGLDVVGFYHSHPRSAAMPSVTDLAEATYHGYLYLIVGLARETPEIALFRLQEGNFLARPFVTVA